MLGLKEVKKRKEEKEEESGGRTEKSTSTDGLQGVTQNLGRDKCVANAMKSTLWVGFGGSILSGSEDEIVRVSGFLPTDRRSGGLNYYYNTISRASSLRIGRRIKKIRVLDGQNTIPTSFFVRQYPTITVFVLPGEEHQNKIRLWYFFLITGND